MTDKLKESVTIIKDSVSVMETMAENCGDKYSRFIPSQIVGAVFNAKQFLAAIESDSDTGGEFAEHTVDDVIAMQTALMKIGVSSPTVSNEWTHGQYLSAGRRIVNRVKEGIYEMSTKDTGGETCPKCGSHKKGAYISGTNYAGCNVGKHHSWHDATPSKSETKRLEGQDVTKGSRAEEDKAMYEYWNSDKNLEDFRVVADGLLTEKQISRAQAVYYLIARAKFSEQREAEISKALDMVIEERDQAFEEISKGLELSRQIYTRARLMDSSPMMVKLVGDIKQLTEALTGNEEVTE